MEGFSLYEYDRLAVFGRTVVVHDGAGTRVGCGVIGGAFGVSSASVTTALYPDFAHAAAYPNVRAVASLSEASGVVMGSSALMVVGSVRTAFVLRPPPIPGVIALRPATGDASSGSYDEPARAPPCAGVP